MQELIAELNRNNFFPVDVIPDGVLRRFDRGKKDNCWIIVWQNARTKDGSFYYVANYGDWRTGETHLYKPKLSRVDTAVVDRQQKERQAQVKKEKELAQLKAADLATQRFKPCEGHTPYTIRKLMPSLYGCGLYGDSVQVPMRDVDGKLWSIQTIAANGDKKYMWSGRKQGCFHLIGEITDAPIYLAEGLSTAASVYQATGATTVVCFDAGNLVEVAAILSTAYPQTEIRIAGDDDRNNPENPGRKKAEKAALVSSGIVVFPEFPDADKVSSDFNDLHVLYGLDAVRDQLAPAVRTSGFIPLGFQDDAHFFYELKSKTIRRATSFSDVQMWSIASADYWEANYPKPKGGGADMKRGAHDLIQTSLDIGPFDASCIRGTGVWLDKGRVVVNTGHSLLVEGRTLSLSAIKSHYVYIQTTNRMPAVHATPLTASEGKKLAAICGDFKWENETQNAQLLAGWLFVARVAGALPIRPHIWITGGKGTGKSTLMEGLIAKLLGAPKGKLHCVGSTTEAGMRQGFKASSLPVIFDEFESDGKSSRDRVDAMVELMRCAWSTTQGRIMKGSASGVSVDYEVHFCALVSSIRVVLNTDADRSRFSVLELARHGDDLEKWAVLEKYLATINEETGERLFARACASVPRIIATQKILAPILAAVQSQRYAQQVGTLLAGGWCLQNDGVITKAAAQDLVDTFFGGEKKDEEISDEDECLTRLLTWKLDLKGGRGLATATMSLGDAIRDPYWKDYLPAYGVKVLHDVFFVSNNHTELEKHYRDTHWGKNWGGSLRRLPGASLKAATTFGSRKNSSRAVSLPIELA